MSAANEPDPKPSQSKFSRALAVFGSGEDPLLESNVALQKDLDIAVQAAADANASLQQAREELASAGQMCEEMRLRLESQQTALATALGLTGDITAESIANAITSRVTTQVIEQVAQSGVPAAQPLPSASTAADPKPSAKERVAAWAAKACGGNN